MKGRNIEAEDKVTKDILISRFSFVCPHHKYYALNMPNLEE